MADMEQRVLSLPHVIHYMLEHGATPTEVALIVYGSFCDLMDRIEAHIKGAAR